MDEKLIYFENSFIQEEEDLKNEGDAKKCITIDGYPENEDLPGEVVCRVWLTKHNDIIVDWHDNRYRLNESVLSLIKESKKLLNS